MDETCTVDIFAVPIFGRTRKEQRYYDSLAAGLAAQGALLQEYLIPNPRFLQLRGYRRADGLELWSLTFATFAEAELPIPDLRSQGGNANAQSQ